MYKSQYSRLLLPALLLQGSFAIAQKTNIVFIIADDCSKWDIGCYGSPDAITPTIDNMAATGMMFTNCYQTAPMCSPTRHSIYTGMYPVRTGAYPNHTYAKEGIKSASHYLKPLGYRVALSGKTHIQPKTIFDFEYLKRMPDNNDPDFEDVDKFLGEVKQNSENFCLFVCSNQPHGPWDKGDQSLFDVDKITLPPTLVNTPETRTNFRNYLAEINYLDGQVKQTIDLLKKHQLDSNTVVVFTSEQGNSFPFAKWTCYNSGLTSALLVVWPGKIAPGSQSDALVEYVDILPTFIDMAGGEPVSGLDGSTLKPLLLQQKTEHKKYVYGLQTTRGINGGAEYYPIRSISDGTYRLILNLTPEMKFQNAITNAGYYLAWANTGVEADKALYNRYLYRPAMELYNDKTDKYNLTNLVGDPQYDEIINELKAELLKWMDYCDDKGIETELRAIEHLSKNQTLQENIVITEMHGPVEDGNIEVKITGFYSFYTPTNCEVYVDGKKVIETIISGYDNNRIGVIGLNPGKHKVEVVGADIATIDLSWSGPAMPKNPLYLGAFNSKRKVFFNETFGENAPLITTYETTTYGTAVANYTNYSNNLVYYESTDTSKQSIVTLSTPSDVKDASGGAALYFGQGSTGSRFLIKNIHTSGYDSISMAYNVFKGAGATANILVRYSVDMGTTWTDLPDAGSVSTGGWVTFSPVNKLPSVENLWIELGVHRQYTLFDDIKLFGIPKNTTKIKKSKVKKTFVYPNPSKGSVSVACDEIVIKMELLNLEGKVLRKSHQSNTMNLSGIENGTYLLLYETSVSGKNVEKILVKN